MLWLCNAQYLRHRLSPLDRDEVGAGHKQSKAAKRQAYIGWLADQTAAKSRASTPLPRPKRPHTVCLGTFNRNQAARMITSCPWRKKVPRKV